MPASIKSDTLMESNSCSEKFQTPGWGGYTYWPHLCELLPKRPKESRLYRLRYRPGALTHGSSPERESLSTASGGAVGPEPSTAVFKEANRFTFFKSPETKQPSRREVTDSLIPSWRRGGGGIQRVGNMIKLTTRYRRGALPGGRRGVGGKSSSPRI